MMENITFYNCIPIICSHLSNKYVYTEHLNAQWNIKRTHLMCICSTCLHLTRIYKHRWMVSENTEHLSSSLTNSDWKSMSIRLTHDSECRLYFISDCNMMPRVLKTWPISDEPRIRDLAVTLMIKHELLFQLITLKRVKLKREEQMRLNLTSAPVR